MLTKDQKEGLDIPSGGDFSPVPMDSYTVQIADVNMISQFNKWRGEEEDVLNFMFIILDDKKMPENEEGKEESTRGRYLWKRCRISLNDRSWLYKLAKAAMGRTLTKEEIDSFDPEAIVGEQVRVMVEQNESKDGQRVFNNITTFAKAGKKLEPVEYDPNKPKGEVERSSTPATAPKKSTKEVDDFVAELEAKKAPAKEEPEADSGEEKSVEQLEKELAAAKAKAKK